MAEEERFLTVTVRLTQAQLLANPAYWSERFVGLRGEGVISDTGYGVEDPDGPMREITGPVDIMNELFPPKEASPVK